MLSKLVIALTLMAVCVVIHAGGLAAALRTLRRVPDAAVERFWAWTGLFILIAGWMVVLHLLEIGAWACLYLWTGTMPDVASAVYFSGVTYTTTGYGDLVLEGQWRLVGAVEALTGILMCGWSTGFFFAVVARMYGAQNRARAA